MKRKKNRRKKKGERERKGKEANNKKRKRHLRFICILINSALRARDKETKE